MQKLTAWTQDKLNEADRRRLSRRLALTEKHSKIYRRRVLQTSPLLFGLLCIWTLLASEAPTVYILIFWLGIGILMTTWLYLESKFQEANKRVEFKGTITADSARRIRVRARRLWEIHSTKLTEAYLFESEKNTVTSFSSIDFQRTSSFPSLDFEYREILDSNGEVIETRFIKYGQQAEPEKIITCSKLPDDLLASPVAFFDSSLENLASKLGH